MLNNGTFFRRVYSDDFAGTSSHGQMVDKNNLINEVQNSGAKYQSFNASDIQVRFFQETAVATCLWTSRAIFNGQQIETQMRVMPVYINGPRGWHVVAKTRRCLLTPRTRYRYLFTARRRSRDGSQRIKIG